MDWTDLSLMQETLQERLERLQAREPDCDRLGPIPGAVRVVTQRRHAQVAYRSVGQVAAMLEVSEARVKRLVSCGRIPGAYRSRRGKNRPWRIPVRWTGDYGIAGVGIYRVLVTAGRRGPEAEYAEKRGIPF